jgi:hypothetical protein
MKITLDLGINSWIPKKYTPPYFKEKYDKTHPPKKIKLEGENSKIINQN